MTRSRLQLPAVRVAADWLGDVTRVAAAAAWLLGPAAWAAIAGSLLGRARAAETGWANHATRILDMRT